MKSGIERTRIRVGAVALALVPAILAAGCGDDSDTGSANASDAEGGSWRPERAVTFVVATGAGGGGDIFGRAAAAGIQEVDPDVRISVENHTGGNEVVGATFALSHSDDPHYMFVANSSLVLIPFSIDPPPDYTWESFTPVAMIGADQQMLVVSEDSPYQSLMEVVEAAKGPDGLRVGLTSTTGTDSAVASLVEDSEGIEFQRVILESGAEGVAALLAGDVDLSFLNPSEVRGQLDAGELRALAVFGNDRYGEGTGLEDVPTAQEQGVDVIFTQFRGLMAPGTIDGAELDYWIGVTEEWTSTDSYDKYIADNAMQPDFRAGDEFRSFIAEQQSQFEQVFGD